MINSWPQAWLSYRTKTAEGTSLALWILLFIGGTGSLVYAIGTKQYSMIPNFIGGMFGGGIVMYYKICDIRKGIK